MVERFLQGRARKSKDLFSLVKWNVNLPDCVYLYQRSNWSFCVFNSVHLVSCYCFNNSIVSLKNISQRILIFCKLSFDQEIFLYFACCYRLFQPNQDFSPLDQNGSSVTCVETRVPGGKICRSRRSREVLEPGV